MQLFPALFLLLLMPSGSPEIHSMKYFYTASSQVPNFPEFVVVGLVDEMEVEHFDSNTRRFVPKQDWMNKIIEEDRKYWERATGTLMGTQKWFSQCIEIAKQRFNQTEGVHILQQMVGCEWDDETDKAVNGYDQYGYDGEDFIAFDLKTETWIAPVQQAVPTKHKWDNDKAELAYLKHYITQICPEFLKKYVSFGRSFLSKKDLPSVSLLQKTPSSPLTCHATGFYPDRADLFWRKDQEELHEDVVKGEILPNHDGSFQMSVDLDLSGLRDEDWGRYSCVFQLVGVQEDLVKRLDKRDVRTNWNGGGRGADAGFPTGAAVGGVAALIVLICGIVLFLVRKRNSQGFRRTNTSDTSSDASSDASRSTSTETLSSSSGEDTIPTH